MGRKQKLREEKRKNKAVAASATKKETTTATATACSTTTTTAPKNQNYTRMGDLLSGDNKIVRENGGNDVVLQKYKMLDAEFPKSEVYKLADDMYGKDTIQQFDYWKQGAIEFGCVSSMKDLGQAYAIVARSSPDPNCQMVIHYRICWVLEGAIRGDLGSISRLLEIYKVAKPHPASALCMYWGKTFNSILGHELCKGQWAANRFEGVVQQCAICSQRDTKKLTLRQCMGCSMYCYCSSECQTTHWETYNHRGECKQLKILHKYHKPYRAEIRTAVIAQGRGDDNTNNNLDIIPVLEKLRHKLGLSRPLKEYIMIPPIKYGVAREDGTVWAGSNPKSPLGGPTSALERHRFLSV